MYVWVFIAIKCFRCILAAVVVAATAVVVDDDVIAVQLCDGVVKKFENFAAATATTRPWKCARRKSNQGITR